MSSPFVWWLSSLLAVAGSAAAPSSDDVAVERWPSLPRAVASFGAASSNGWLYVYGGHVGRMHQHSRDNLTGQLYRLSLADGVTWQELPAGPPLQGLALVAAGGGIVRLGGLSAQNAAGEEEQLESVSSAARFDPEASRWDALPALPEPRSSHDAAALGSRVFVVGGWTLAKGEETWLRSAWTIDLAAPKPVWSKLPDAPFERRSVAAAVLDSKLYVIGGLTPDGDMSSRVDVLDLEKRAWSRAADLPGTGFGTAAIAHGGRLYATVMEGALVRLSQDGKSWEPVAQLAFPRFFHRLAPRPDGALLAAGGSGPDGVHLSVIEPVDVSGARAKPRVAAWTLPFPGGAKSRHGVARMGEEIVLFGGNSSLEQHDFEPERFLAESWSLHLGSLALRKLPDAPGRGQSFATASLPIQTTEASDDAPHGSTIAFAVGGFGNDGSGERSRVDAWKLESPSRAWTKCAAALPVPRTQHALVAHGGALWVLGGLDYDRKREDAPFRLPLEVLRWDPAKADSTFADAGVRLPRPRRAFASAVVGSKCYLIGGMRDDFEPVPECDVLDLETRAWSTIPAPRATRVGAECVALGGKIYLVAGATPSDEGRDFSPDATIEVFDPATNAWSVVPVGLPIAPRHLHAVALKDAMLLMSTFGEAAELQVAWLRP